MSEDTKDMTTVPLSKQTRKRLKLWKTGEEMTYDEAINELLNRDEANNDGEN